jgi:hypothetical protein
MKMGKMEKILQTIPCQGEGHVTTTFKQGALDAQREENEITRKRTN